MRYHCFLYSLSFYLLLEFLIFSFISRNSFSTLSVKMNLSKLIFDSIKTLEIKTSVLINLDFANNICNFIMLVLLFLNPLCFYFLISFDLHFWIPAVITQIVNLIVELAIRMRIPTKEAKVELEKYPVILEITISEWSIQNSTNVFIFLTY